MHVLEVVVVIVVVYAGEFFLFGSYFADTNVVFLEHVLL